MSFSMIMTLLMLAVIMVLLVKGVTSPGLIFAVVPVITAFILGYNPAQIESMYKTGLNSISTSAVLMVFAVCLFGIVDAAGGLDWMVSKIIKLLGNNVVGVTVVTTLLSFATQLDGSGASTALATIPTMKPIYEKMKIPRESLVMSEGIASGVLTLLPWAPGMVEAAAFAGVDGYALFKFMIPALIAGIIICLLNCFVVAWRAKRSGAGMTDAEFEEVRQEMLSKKVSYPLGPKMALFDGLYAIACMLILILGLAKSTSLFVFAMPILVWINFRHKKEQNDFLKTQAQSCFNMVLMMFGLAMMLGVINGTGGLADLATLIAGALPASLVRKLPFLVCLFAVPLNTVLGNSVRAVIVPAIIAITSLSGIDAMAVAGPVLVCANMAVNLFVGSGPAYMCCGLADIEFGDNLKYGFFNTWLASAVLAVVMVVLGVLPW